jgi:hypothetical protein
MRLAGAVTVALTSFPLPVYYLQPHLFLPVSYAEYTQLFTSTSLLFASSNSPISTSTFIITQCIHARHDSQLEARRKSRETTATATATATATVTKGMAPPPNTRPKKKIAPELTTQEQSGSKRYLVLADEHDCTLFSCMDIHENSETRALQILEIHLDASKQDKFVEFRLALALTGLHPRHDGTNPHNYRTIKIVVKGNVLFTRYRYHLTSPAMSHRR